MPTAHIQSCPNCLGTGKVGYTFRRICRRCSGRGWLRRRQVDDVISKAVERLLGIGKERRR